MPKSNRLPKILAAVSVLLTTAGLSMAVGQNSKPVSTGSSGKAEPVMRANPNRVRNLQGDAREMERLAEAFLQQKKLPGMAMALVQDGRVLSARGYGVADIRTGQPVKSDTVFRLASLSKAFAATLTGILVEEQALGWDTPIAKQLPAFKLRDFTASQKLTVSDILSHQVGLAKNTYDRDLESSVPYPLLAERLSDAPLACTPGECYGYQNIAYSLIGDMVFAVTGDFYTHQVEEKIFIPLGMKNATYGRDSLMATGNWARPHTYGGKGWVSGIPNENYYHVPPAAGVNASITDMAIWLNAQLGHYPDVLSPELLRKIHTPLVNTPGEIRSSGWRHERIDRAAYALGWRVFSYRGRTMVFHAGHVRGYQGVVAFLPEEDVGIAVLWNSESSAPSALLPAWMDRALGIPGRNWLDLDESTGPAAD
ncbi:serine hydrolase domain-containing protein [Arenimonas sp. GDDSR-1]|uniref:serine hydrolase domain-containing protein n=1 Tax=Arenimonas sp. GDDSR-1 TaxID=2950125 RepID=UPI00263153CE|nr:serine hydrolase domain-containing protein [Arenimonas sp. GDDSR-1]